MKRNTANQKGFYSILVLLLVAGQGCGDSPANTPTDTQPAAPMSATAEFSVTETMEAETITTGVSETGAQPSSHDGEENVGVSYLEEVIAPCTPVGGSTRDPCAAGAPPLIADLAFASEETKETALPLHTILNYGDLVSSLTTHIVLRGTVLPGSTRCRIYDLVMAEYLPERIRQQFAGWEKINCFADVRVSEYLLGTGPPKLSVILWIDNPPHPDPPWDVQLADTYEGAEGVLFLSTGHSLTVEAWQMAFFWDVQEVDGMVRVIAPDRDEYPPTPENLALLDFTLEDFRTKITEAAATRFAHTGGRIGTDPSLPLLIGDANLLSTYYGAIGAVYDDPSQTPATPPPVPGGDEPEGPPANMGEPDTGDDQPPPVPGDDSQPSDTVP